MKGSPGVIWIFAFFMLVCSASPALCTNIAVLINTQVHKPALDREFRNWEIDRNVKKFFDRVISIHPDGDGGPPDKKNILSKLKEILNLEPPRSVFYFIVGGISPSNRLYTLDFKELGEEFIRLDGELIAENIAMVIVSGGKHPFHVKTEGNINFCLSRSQDADSFPGAREKLAETPPPLSTENFQEILGAPMRPILGWHFNFKSTNLLAECRIPDVIDRPVSAVVFPRCLTVSAPVLKYTPNSSLKGRIALLKKEDNTNYAIHERVKPGSVITPVIYDDSLPVADAECALPDLIGKKLSEATFPDCLIIHPPRELKTEDIRLDGRIASFTANGAPVHPWVVLPHAAEITPVVHVYDKRETLPDKNGVEEPGPREAYVETFRSIMDIPDVPCNYPEPPGFFMSFDDDAILAFTAMDERLSGFEVEKIEKDALSIEKGQLLDYASSPHHRSPYFYLVSTPWEGDDDQYRINCRVYCKSTRQPVSTNYSGVLRDDVWIDLREMEGEAFAHRISNTGIVVYLVRENSWIVVKNARRIVGFDLGLDEKNDVCLIYATVDGNLHRESLVSDAVFNSFPIVPGGLENEEIDDVRLIHTPFGVYLVTPKRGTVFFYSTRRMRELFLFDNEKEKMLSADVFFTSDGSGSGIFTMRRIHESEDAFSYKATAWIYRDGRLDPCARDIDFTRAIGSGKIDELSVFVKPMGTALNRFRVIAAYNTGGEAFDAPYKPDIHKGRIKKVEVVRRPVKGEWIIKEGIRPSFEKEYDSIVVSNEHLAMFHENTRVGVIYYDIKNEEGEIDVFRF